MSADIPKVLCVDDEPGILQSLERLLKGRFQVFTTNSVEHALDWLSAHPDCAIVLSDYRMPGRNGLELLREVKQRFPLTSRAVLSGQMDLRDISAAINSADIHKFFLKPWENEYLVVQMLEALQVHQTLREKAHFEQLSITDPVTGLTNHRYFQDQLRADLDKAAKENLPLALIIFDVDHFKAFNDRFGHPLGDRLLARVARTLADLAGSQGIVSRYGGEEFTLILPGCSESKAKLFADNIRRHFERTPFTGLMPNATPAYITVSAGVCCYPAHGATANELIESADRALYQAKRQGRNQVGLAKRM